MVYLPMYKSTAQKLAQIIPHSIILLLFTTFKSQDDRHFRQQQEHDYGKLQRNIRKRKMRRNRKKIINNETEESFK